MPLIIGSRLGPYEVIAAIGAGGMGEVYRARDTKLGRDVAIKVLPEAFARDAARMARFSREAKLLAALNHTNIAAIYGLEDTGPDASGRALVMELAEGPTLADRIRQGPVPIEDALRIARQMADALEYAHERGIIHRDLKPANVKVAPDDTVKILDFGLAKAMDTELSAAEIANSPTLSHLATQAGVLLGTAAYMSPEQAKAKPVDRRADIWAFGSVLYEMLTGKMAFHGDTVTDTLAAVIKEEPNWPQLPSATPMRVRVLLQRCLQKDPKQRLRDIGDARISLDEVLSGAPEGAPGLAATVPAWRRVVPWALGLIAVVVTGVAVWMLKPTVGPLLGEPIRLQIPLPETQITLAPTGVFAVSPDGRQLAFAASGSDGVQRLWVRSLDSLEARPMPGSESSLFAPFFWSPDSRFIAFDAGGKLKKIPVSGGPAETICEISGIAIGGSWNRDGVIIFGTTGGPLMRVSAAGGTPSALTTLDPLHGAAAHELPAFLPDGRHFIYLRVSDPPESSGVYVGSLDAKPEEQSSRRILTTRFGAAYAPSSDGDLGELLFVRDGALLAQPFDARRLQLAGEPVTLAEGLGPFLQFGFFAVSANGVLVYRTGAGGSERLTWYDEHGKTLGTAGEPDNLIRTIELSPDGTRVAVGAARAVWLLDFSRGTNARFAFGPGLAQSAVWSADGNRIIFASNREGHFDLYQKPASGATDEQLLLQSDDNKYPTGWSRDGRFLLYTVVENGKSSISVLPLAGDKKPFPFSRSEFNEDHGSFSPDGHWVAYVSDESARHEIYVRTFSMDSSGKASGTGGKWLISNRGGFQPRWRGDGKELYYVASDGKLMAVEVSTNSEF